jgi:hypothetical protein
MSGLGFRVVEKYRQTYFPKIYIDMQPIVERMQPDESLVDFVGQYWCQYRNGCIKGPARGYRREISVLGTR